MTVSAVLDYKFAIWNIYIATPDLMLLELRDKDSMSTLYDLYSISNGKYVWRNFNLDETWKLGVTHFSKEYLVIHYYNDNPLPGIEKIITISTKDCKMLNQISSFQPIDVGGSIIRGRDENGNIVFHDLNTGKPQNEVLNFHPDINNRIELPFLYKEDTENFETVRRFLNNELDIEISGLAEYLEISDYIFVAYHLQGEQELINELLVLSNDGRLLRRVELNRGGNYFTDSFFVWNDKLFYTEQGKKLNIINLEE